jgi:hypothetical protein
MPRVQFLIAGWLGSFHLAEETSVDHTFVIIARTIDRPFLGTLFSTYVHVN